MKCESCGQNDATIKYYENINGVKKLIYICPECAAKLGILSFSPSFTSLISNPKINIKEETKKCSNCGYTYDKYLKTGFFGCPHCYETFSDKIDSLLLNIHGHYKHKEKLVVNKEDVNLKTSVNKTKNVKKQVKTNDLEELKKLLKLHIQNEQYEDAAVIRDKIKKIEGR